MVGVCWSTYFVDIPLILSCSQPSVAATYALYFRRTVRLQQVRQIHGVSLGDVWNGKYHSLVLQRVTSLALMQVNILATLFSSMARLSCCNTPPQLWRAYVTMIVACLVTPPYTIYTMGGTMKELQALAKQQTSNNEKYERSLVARFGRLHLPRALWLSAALVILAYNSMASQ